MPRRQSLARRGRPGATAAIASKRGQQVTTLLYGQEINPETYAVCKSDLYMKSADGRQAEGI